MPTANPSQPLVAFDDAELTLSASAILKLKADYDSDVRLLEELPNRIAFKKKRLDAALLFAPPGFSLDAPPVAPTATVPPESAHKAVPVPSTSTVIADEAARPHLELSSDEDRLSWAAGVYRELLRAQRGVSHQDLLETLKQTPLGERVSDGAKGFYNAISRLTNNGKVIKAGGLLYAHEVAERLTASGEELPDWSVETRRRAGGSASFVIDALRANPDGLSGPQIKEIVTARADAPKSLAAHSQYIYNVLGTLIGNGTVEKSDGIYRLAQQGQK